MSDDGGQLLILAAALGGLLLFLIEAAFSVALSASTALSRVALRRLSAEDSGRFSVVETLREPRSTQRTAAHVARQLCLLGGALVMALGWRAAGWPVPGILGLLVAAVVGVLLFEVILAPTIALRDPRRALRRTAFLLRTAHTLLYPVVVSVHMLLGRVIRGQSDENREDEQDEEVDALIEVGERDGILEAGEGKMMRSIVDLDETVVREIMTPRPDIVALPHDTTVEEARRTFLEAGHSRIPVFRDGLDEIVGVLHLRDLLRATDEGHGSQAISGYLREVMFVPETRSVAELLSELRLKAQLAVVIDEYGGTAGLVTIEDLVEEIVGEIRDEHETAESMVHQERDGSFTINAAAHVEELEELFGIECEGREFDTIGGLVVSALGRVPAKGDSLTFQSLRIEILRVDGRRIRQVRVRPLGSPSQTRAEL